MLSDRTRQEIWNELLDVDRACRYYEAVYARATKWHLIIRVAVLVALAGGIAAILDFLPGPTAVYQVVLAALIAALTVWEAVANYAKKAAVSHAIYIQFTKLRVQLRDLWLLVDDEVVDEADVRRRVRELALMSGETENWAGASDITPNAKLNERTQKDAFNIVSDRYKEQQPQVSE